MIEKIAIVVGFDQREAVAYHTFCQSVLEKSSTPVCFIPLVKNFFANDFGCKDGSNAFTYTRFLTPYLLNFKGFAIYVDGDMICNDDISKLWHQRDESKAVQVVKHSYESSAKQKYLGNKNENYPRKNWSSVIIWNCEHQANEILQPAFVSRKDGAFLHRFQWLPDALIGELNPEWNWLAIEYPPNHEARLIHYTLGTPCFSNYRDTDLSTHWHEAYLRLNEGFD